MYRLPRSAFTDHVGVRHGDDGGDERLLAERPGAMLIPRSTACIKTETLKILLQRIDAGRAFLFYWNRSHRHRDVNAEPSTEVSRRGNMRCRSTCRIYTGGAPRCSQSRRTINRERFASALLLQLGAFSPS